MDIVFLITTCNRQESCQRLVDALQGLGDVVVVNDGGKYTIDGALNIANNKHLGKTGYWKTVNTLFNARGKHKYYFILPDDFMPVPNMGISAIDTWENINDPRKVCLSLSETRTNVSCWTNFKAVDRGPVWLTQWVDMCFMCEDRFFNALGILPPLFGNGVNKRYKGSSRVGAYISRILHRRKYNLYQVKESLVIITPEHYNSQMHNE
jgi:hypothetical protein